MKVLTKNSTSPGNNLFHTSLHFSYVMGATRADVTSTERVGGVDVTAEYDLRDTLKYNPKFCFFFPNKGTSR